jgi:hypothetical protein
MHTPESHFPSSDISSRNASQPPFQVVQSNEHGLVLESQRSFEIGSTIAMGFHVDCHSRHGKSRFISVEAMVVGSSPKVTRKGQLCMEVTLLFSEIDREDREVLLRASSLSRPSVTGEPKKRPQRLRYLN